ncbi:MAG: glycosyltransferase [Bacilli bacterium]|nr:glycosyltransferase [Bacilli bacterium]
MNFSIDECKINNNKVFINGWAHFDKYKILLVSNDEEKEITEYIPRYDICMAFHEKIEENMYGFKEEVIFKNNIKVLDIYLINNEEKILLRKLDNRKVIQYAKKTRKVLGKVKRGVKFLWKEHHFLVSPSMMKKYFNDIKNRNKNRDDIIYNPEIDSEYNEWLKQQSYLPEIENDFVTVITSIDDIKNVKTKYVCLSTKNIKLVEGFYAEIKQYVDEKYDLIYFDNDIEINGKYTKPLFKPGWSIDTLLGVNYIGNCFVLKTDILKKLKLKDLNLYYILLKLRKEKIKVKHICKILYHDTVKTENEIDTLKKYLKEEKINANVSKNPDGITNTVTYEVKDNPLISIVIPTKDHADILDQCLKSVYEKSTYKNFEIIVIDNNSSEQETFDLLEEYNKKDNFSYKRIECEFNFSYLNNEAVKMSKGDYILMLNNDIEVITPEWLDIMVGYASQDNVGTVGAKLIFPDETLQHAGIIMGKGGLAGHAHYAKPRNYISSQYELKVPYDYSACTAACLMVSKKKYKEVKGLEEDLKVAFNDVDFNLKLLDKGYNNVFLPNVELYHYESKSRGLDTTPEKQKRFIQEWSYIIEHWQKYIDSDDYYNDNFSKNVDYMLK